jgi:TRAP-type uncharacterized transport system substrate-binding protein
MGLGGSTRTVAVLGLLAVLAAGLFLHRALRPASTVLRMSAGDALGRRHALAELLVGAAAAEGLDLHLEPSSGSEDALARVARGELDVALVQGGLQAQPSVREVAPLALEPLHLLVRAELEVDGVAGLRGKRVSLSPPGSGTRAFALDVLDLFDLRPGRDFVDATTSYEELERLPATQLPDAVFHVSTLPSPVARFLVRERGYRLVELPFVRSLAVRSLAVRDGTLPAYLYSARPPVPERDLVTPAMRMLLVAHERVPAEPIRRLVEVVRGDAFLRAARLPPVAELEMREHTALPLHPGAVAYLRRNDPVVTSDFIESIENLRSFLVSLGVALFFFYRWVRARRLHDFDTYLRDVTLIEREAADLERAASLDLEKLIALRQRIITLKTQALDDYANGKLRSPELLAGFVAQASDAREHLDALILHARERLEKKARREADVGGEEQRLAELWRDAIGSD